MDKKMLAVVAAAGGLVVGVAGARLLAPVPPGTACAPAADAAADAKANAIARQLHAHDRDAYVPHPAPAVGELPKPAKAVPAGGAAH